MFTGIIFDFDGTLVRSHEAVYDVLKQISVRTCARMPAPEFLRELSSREMLDVLGIKAWQIPWFTFRARRALRAKVHAVDFEPGVVDLLRAARRARLKIGLVSSNSKANVRQILDRHGVADVFNQTHFGSALFGKRQALIGVARKLGVPSDQVLCVGDETRDIEAARAAGLRSVAVGWGFHALGRLKTFGPDFTAETPAQLRTILGLL